MSGLEEVMAAHQSRFHGMSADCTCGEWTTDADESPEGHDEPHRAHVANALRAHLMSDEVVRSAARQLHQRLMPGQPHPPDDPKSEWPCIDYARAALTAALEDA